MPKPDRPEPLNWRKLLDVLIGFLVLELGFYLFRLGAVWWNQ